MKGWLSAWWMVWMVLPVVAEVASERLVTLGSPVTEVVFALGKGAAVVAVDASSQFPEEVEDLPEVGYVAAVGAEGILSLRPDRILATDRLGPPAVVEKLRQSAVPLHLLETPHDRESLEQLIRSLGRILDAEGAAATLWESLARELEGAAERVAGATPRAVFLIGSGGSAMAAGEDTQGGGIIRLAGGENVFKEFTGYRPVSEEALLNAMPDLVLIGSHSGGSGAEEQLKAMGLERLWAIHGDAVRVVDLGGFLSFGPRTGAAVMLLAGWFAEVEEKAGR